MNTYKIFFTRENGTTGTECIHAKSETQAVHDFYECYRHGTYTIAEVKLVCKHFSASEVQGRKVSSSKIGFCIGAPFAVLTECPKTVGITPWDIWGDTMQEHISPVCEDGPTGLQVISAETFFNQNENAPDIYPRIYHDQNGRRYTSEDDCFCLVPLEIMLGNWMPDPEEAGCQFFYGAGQASMEERDGVITVELPTGETVVIDTKEYKDDEEETA